MYIFSKALARYRSLAYRYHICKKNAILFSTCRHNISSRPASQIPGSDKQSQNQNALHGGHTIQHRRPNIKPPKTVRNGLPGILCGIQHLHLFPDPVGRRIGGNAAAYTVLPAVRRQLENRFPCLTAFFQCTHRSHALAPERCSTTPSLYRLPPVPTESTNRQ